VPRPVKRHSRTLGQASVLSLEATRMTPDLGRHRIRQGKSLAKVPPANRRCENEKAPLPGLFQ
jgi:hypothetical protein